MAKYEIVIVYLINLASFCTIIIRNGERNRDRKYIIEMYIFLRQREINKIFALLSSLPFVTHKESRAPKQPLSRLECFLHNTIDPLRVCSKAGQLIWGETHSSYG